MNHYVEGSITGELVGGTITVKQTRSPIRSTDRRRKQATLIGLGLNKLNRISTLPLTEAVLGMIRAVEELVQVIAIVPAPKRNRTYPVRRRASASAPAPISAEARAPAPITSKRLFSAELPSAIVSSLTFDALESKRRLPATRSTAVTDVWERLSSPDAATLMAAMDDAAAIVQSERESAMASGRDSQKVPAVQLQIMGRRFYDLLFSRDAPVAETAVRKVAALTSSRDLNDAEIRDHISELLRRHGDRYFAEVDYEKLSAAGDTKRVRIVLALKSTLPCPFAGAYIGLPVEDELKKKLTMNREHFEVRPRGGVRLVEPPAFEDLDDVKGELLKVHFVIDIPAESEPDDRPHFFASLPPLFADYFTIPEHLN